MQIKTHWYKIVHTPLWNVIRGMVVVTISQLLEKGGWLFSNDNMSTSLGNVASYSSCLVADGDCGYQKLCEGFEIAFFSAPPSFQNCSVGTTMVTRKEVAFYFIQEKI